MPNLSLQTQSLVPETSTSVGGGGPGTSAIVGGVLGAAGQIAQSVDLQKQRQKAIQEKQTQDEVVLDTTNAASAEQLTSLQEADDAAKNGQMPGFVDRWQKDFDARTTAGAQAILPIGRAHYTQQMAQLRAQLLPRFYGAEMGARNAKLKQDNVEGTDVDASTAFIDRSQAPDLLGRRLATIDALALPDEEKAGLKTLASQKISYAAGANWASNDPDGFLKSLGVGAADAGAAETTRQADPVLSRLAPQNLEQLVNHAQSLVARRDAQNAAAKDQAEAIGAKTYNGLLDLVAGGQVPSLDYATQVAQGTKGTSFEPLAQAAMQRAYAGAGFGAQSLPRQQTLLTGYEANANAAGTDPDTQRALDQMRTIHATQTAAYADNPWEAATRFAHAPAQPLQQVTSVQQGLQLAQQRMPALPAIEVASGAPQSPLQPAEAAQLGTLLKALPPDQAASALSTLGQAAGSQERVAALANQFKDTDGAMGLAMAYAGNRTSTGRLVGELVLRGNQALKDKTATIAEGSAIFSSWQTEIASEIKGAYSNQQVENDAIRAAFLIAAARSSLGQSDDIGVAVRMATGGITTHGAAGAKIPLPYGMDPSAFDKKFNALQASNFAQQVPDGVVHVGPATIPLQQFVDSLKDATLVHAGQGLYNVKGGNTLATNSQGQRIMIHITP